MSEMKEGYMQKDRERQGTTKETEKNKQKIAITYINEKKKKEIKFKKMQVLMKGKIYFVSAVGVHLLTSFWICLSFNLSSRTYCVTLE